MPSARKRVRPGGNAESLPNSSSTSNLTCFFGGLSSMGASSHHALLLDSWSLSYKWRCSKEQLSHSSVGQDHGGLGEGDWHWLGNGGQGLWHHLNLFLPLEWVCLFLNQDHPTDVSSLSCLVNSAPKAWLRGIWSVKWNGHGSISSFLKRA